MNFERGMRMDETEKIETAKPVISYADFSKLDLRVALVEKAERVEGTDKLLKLGLKIGNEKRQIVSGIFPQYAPENMLNKKIIVIFNLEPRTIRGLESQGMLLAAQNGGELVLLTVDKDIADGSTIS